MGTHQPSLSLVFFSTFDFPDRPSSTPSSRGSGQSYYWNAYARQTCTPVTQDVGVCTPVGAGRCLKQIGEECQDNGECDSGTCQIFGDVKSCTGVCDLKTRTGCPKDTTCIEIQGTSGGVCKPKGKPVKSVCGNAEGAACGGCQNGKPGLIDIGLFVALAGWLLRRRS